MTFDQRGIEAIYPLTPSQEGILFHILYAPESPMYFQQFRCDLGGSLRPEDFVAAWKLVTRRHPALRALLAWEGLEEPLLIVRPEAEPEWHVEDLRASAPDEQHARIRRHIEEDRARGFDVQVAPLTRFALFHLTDQTHAFVWSFHHAILDGWSMRLLLDEVFAIHEVLASGADPQLPDPPEYKGYVQWLQSQNSKRPESEAHWRDKLRGFADATPLPSEIDSSGPPWSEHHAEETRILTEGATDRITAGAREKRLTLNTLLRGAWAVVLSRYSGVEDVVFGATHSGRSSDLLRAPEMVGLFINTLPVRVRLDSSEPVGLWLRRLQEEQAVSRPHESVPLSEVQRWSEVPQPDPIFRSILVLENLPEAGPPAHGLTRSGEEYIESSNYPLALLAVPGERLQLTLVYDAERFDPDVMRRILRQVEELLRVMLEDAARPVGELPILPSDELQEIVGGWNATRSPYPVGRCVHDLIEEAMGGAREDLAVIGPEGSLTYRELEERSGLIAHRLRARGVGPDARVVVCLERSPGMVAGMLGVLRAGGAYVPLDPDMPARRLSHVVSDTNAVACIAPPDREVEALGLSGFDGSIVRVDGGGTIVSQDTPGSMEAASEAEGPVGADNLAYVIYTSGSTGRPKGVAVSHRNLVNSNHARFELYPERVGCFLLLSPFVFDSSVAGLFWTLCQGGTLVLPGPGMEKDVRHLGELIATHGVTHTLALPTLYGMLLEHADERLLQSLEVVIVAGEACPRSVVERHFARLPSTSLYNEYGPTEATVWCTAHQVPPPSEAGGHARWAGRIPIGRPIANTQTFVLDAHDRHLPVGAPGELYVAGEGLARGYLGSPELTAERFVEKDVPGRGPTRLYRTGDVARFLPDGNLDLLGRLDHQVKIRGQRIELDEIAEVLKEHPGVRDAVVTAHVRDSDTLALVAYAEIGGELDGAAEALRNYLAEGLPDAMVPSLVVPLADLPRGATGKIDRHSLPLPSFDEAEDGASASAFEPPRGKVEETLAGIWASALGIEGVGATDDFFELGGDSILSIRVIARAAEAGLRITPRAFFDAPTVRELAAFIEASALEGGS
jgi:amino acid adenylation domain-containing protein